MSEKLFRAMHFRETLRENSTDALRIVDGAGDGFEDLEIDDFAGRWLVQTRGPEFPAGLLEAAPAPLRAIYWKRLGDKTSSPQWMRGEVIAEPFVAQENGVRYEIDFSAGYSQGVFLDQRLARAHLRATSAGLEVLNCFAYTCAFGVSAALGGARTVNLDLSRKYLDWGRRNYELNGLDPAGHEFIAGDVFEWLKRLAKKRRLFDVIILDPPTFSRDEKGRVFRVENDFPELVRAAGRLLRPRGRLYCSTNQRSLGPESFQALLHEGCPAFTHIELTRSAMPPDFRGEQYLKAFWIQTA